MPVENGLYKGVSFPLGGSIQEFLEDKGDRHMLRTAIMNILFTRKGERPMLPEFGSNLQDLLFEPADEETEALIIEIVKDDVEKWDDRIQVLGTEISHPTTDPNTMQVVVRYKLRRTSQEDTDELSFSIDSSGSLI